MKIPIFPGKYHQNGGFSMAMLVSGRVLVMCLGGGFKYFWNFHPEPWGR